MCRRTLRKNILKLIEPARVVEFWARNGSYDNVLLCQLFGDMSGFYDALHKKGVGKVRFRDMNELISKMPNIKIFQQDPRGEHIAINDARHERMTYLTLKKVEKIKGDMPAPHLPHIQ